MKSFSVKLPRLGSSPLISQWLLAMIGLSIVANLDGGWLVSKLALIPSRVWLGEIWRLATWPLIELGPISLILTCVMIFRFGSDLAARWGERRFQRVMLQLVVGAAVIGVLVATVGGVSRIGRVGGWAVSDMLVILWARQFPTQEVRVYGITMSGRKLIQITIGVTVLFAIFGRPLLMGPELGACALAYWYPRKWLSK